ncbi:MAG TPA: lamin tail domain-containing protein [Flavisolibacter sp.]
MKKQLLFSVWCFLASFVSLAQAAKSPVVISQVYGGQGNVYQNDFVELFNRSNVSVTLTGHSVQYASASGSTFSRIIALPTITLLPGQYYLISCAATAATGLPLPTPDLVAPTMDLGPSNGRVALSSTTTALSGAANACFFSGTVLDFLGYGTAFCYEGAGALQGMTLTTAAVRQGSGTIDGNNNSVDFVVQTPAPRNSASLYGPTISLPVRLQSFTATKGPGSVGLAWKTALEESTESFIIERSSDSRHYTSIGTQPAAGIPSTYAYTDVAPPAGTQYYRLRVTDSDGAVSYSHTIVVVMAGKAAAHLYPNPAANTVVLHVAGAEGKTIQVTDLSGRVFKTIALVQPGVNNLPIDISDLVSGVYLVKVGTDYLRLVKQ